METGMAELNKNYQAYFRNFLRGMETYTPQCLAHVEKVPSETSLEGWKQPQVEHGGVVGFRLPKLP